MPTTVLIADDNPTIRKLLCQLFESHEMFGICKEAANGQQAIEQALRHHPDIIILDLSMPVMNGLTAAQELKRLMPDVPIILFTQFGELGSMLPGSKLPVDRVVSKTDIARLMEYVRSLVPH